jgi:putative transposase
LLQFGYIPIHAKVSSGTISYKAGRFFVSVLCEVDSSNTQMNTNDGIGVDVGIKHFAVCSHHEMFKNINYTQKVRKLEKSLKRQQRKLSRKYENKKKGGESCYKNIQKQMRIIQKLHVRLVNIREEYVRYVVNALVKKQEIT